MKRKALRELIKQDEIVRSGKGGKGDPYRYSCSQNFARFQQENESREQANDDAGKNTCSLVPKVGQEQQNNKYENN